ncbi:OsmC family protein [Haloplanus halophilus]|uniref:OsmC family protein n=1 Tax=Haloplanus halophilus TaxID=2949993 RepID=UPI00203C015A|nr:OsmC family protein [Haloplanus sp. GDY1]
MAKDSTATGSEKTIEIAGHGRGPKRTRVETDAAEFVVGEEASPLEHLLGSLAACINVIGHLVATDHGIDVRDIDVHVAGDIDTAKYRGEATAPRAGFRSIRVDVTVDADAGDEALERWLADVEERCPVADNLSNDTALESSVGRA